MILAALRGLWAQRVGYPLQLEVLWQPRFVTQHVEGYLAKELGLPGNHWATRTAMPTPLLRQQVGGLVAGAAGAGLGVGDFRYLRGRDIRNGGSGGVIVTVHGERPRKVVAFDEFATDLVSVARRARGELVLSGEHDERKHVTGKATERVRKITGIRIQASRLRTAWLTRHRSRGTPLQLLLPAAGIKSLRMLEELLPFAEVPSDHDVWFR